MSNNPNVFTDLRGEEKNTAGIEAGDVALILKKDGSVQALNFGYDATRLLLPEDQMTADDKAMQRQGQKLFALGLAAQNPVVMQLLLNLSNDPEVVNLSKLRSMTQVH